MSEDTDLGDLLDAASAAEARSAFQRLLAGGADPLVRALLPEVMAEPIWRRHRVLERLRELAEADAVLLHGPLVEALRDDADAERRNAARSALAALASPEAGGNESARQLLERLVTGDSAADVRVLAASALGESRSPGARPALEQALRDPDENVVSAAADALGVLGDGRAAEALGELVVRGRFWGRMSAVVALGRLRDRRGVPALAVSGEDPLLAEAAAAALGEIGDPAGLEPLRAILERAPAEPLRNAAHRAAASILAASHSVGVPAWLRESVRGREPELARGLREEGDDCAARLLGIAGTPEGAAGLIAALAQGELRPAAETGLALLPHPVAAAAIFERLPDADPEERASLLTSLAPPEGEEEARRLLPYLAAPDDAIRTAAAETLGRAREPLVLPLLLDALEEPGTRRGAAQALARLGPASCEPLADLLEDVDPRVREAAAEALAHCGAQEGERILAALARETDPGARSALVRALGAAGGDTEAVAQLAALLSSDEVELRFAAARALGETRSAEAFAPLLAALSDPAPEVQAAALRALGTLGDVRAAGPLAERLDITDRDLRRTAAAALRDVAPAAARERLIRALDDADWEVRLAAVRTLERIGPRDSTAELRRLAAEDPDPLVREAAERALASPPEGSASTSAEGS